MRNFFFSQENRFSQEVVDLLWGAQGLRLQYFIYKTFILEPSFSRNFGSDTSRPAPIPPDATTPNFITYETSSRLTTWTTVDCLPVLSYILMPTPQVYQIHVGPITAFSFNSDGSKLAISPNSSDLEIYEKTGHTYSKIDTLADVSIPFPESYRQANH